MSGIIFSIIPLRRVPPALSRLDYFLAEKQRIPEIGEVVDIPFGSKKIKGVVWKKLTSTALPSGKIKFFTPPNQPIKFSNYLLVLAEWISFNTLTPLNLVLMGMEIGSQNFNYRLDPVKPKPSLFLASDLETREALIKKWIQMISQETKPTLVLVPAYAYADFWIKYKIRNSIFLNSKLNKKEKAEAFSKLGQVKLIIATYSGLLYPLPKLGRVIIDQADDEGFFAFDQAPKIDIRAVAKETVYLHNAKLTILARWPSPTVLGFSPSKPYTILKAVKKPTIINRSLEDFKDKKELISQQIFNQLLPGRTFWLVFRRDEAGIYQCNDCKSPVTCPKCNLPLKVLQQGPPITLFCEKDKLRILAPEKCPNCQGVNFSLRRFGLKQYQKYLKNIFPEKKIAALDKNTVIEKDFLTAEHLIGTTAITNYPELRFENLVVINPETVLNSSEYRNEEAVINSIISVAQHLTGKSEFFIQTNNPGLSIAEKFTDLLNASEKMLEERKAFNYPPFGLLIVLNCNSKDKSLPPIPIEVENQLATKFEVIKSPDQWIIKGPVENKNWILKLLQENLDPSWLPVINPPY